MRILKEREVQSPKRLQPLNIEATLVTAEVSNPDKSIDLSDEQLPNMPLMSVTAEVVNPVKVSDVSAEQLPSIEAMLVTAEVLRPDRSSVASDEQPKNMLLILVTAEVSMPDRFTEVSDWQLLNIEAMLVTVEVVSPDRFAEASDEQLLNMLLISVTFEASRPDRSTLVMFPQPSNIPAALVEAATPDLSVAVLMLEALPAHGLASARVPAVAPSAGSTVRLPSASIIHRHVPFAVQSTMLPVSPAEELPSAAAGDTLSLSTDARDAFSFPEALVWLAVVPESAADELSLEDKRDAFSFSDAEVAGEAFSPWGTEEAEEPPEASWAAKACVGTQSVQVITAVINNRPSLPTVDTLRIAFSVRSNGKSPEHASNPAIHRFGCITFII